MTAEHETASASVRMFRVSLLNAGRCLKSSHIVLTKQINLPVRNFCITRLGRQDKQLKPLVFALGTNNVLAAKASLALGVLQRFLIKIFLKPFS